MITSTCVIIGMKLFLMVKTIRLSALTSNQLLYISFDLFKGGYHKRLCNGSSGYGKTFNLMLNAIPCFTIPYHTLPCHPILYHIPYHAIPYHTILYHTIPSTNFYFLFDFSQTASEEEGVRRRYKIL